MEAILDHPVDFLLDIVVRQQVPLEGGGQRASTEWTQEFGILPRAPLLANANDTHLRPPIPSRLNMLTIFQMTQQLIFGEGPRT